jgi:predicted GNAT superfamily acetyltransferase
LERSEDPGGETRLMIEVRELQDHAELAEAVNLQKIIWGFDEIELLPVRLLVVATKVGGQVLGAFEGRKLVGFCFCIPGLKPGGKSYLHSHMMGVLQGYRDRGVGRMLKVQQRSDAVARGIDLIEWTFDPLEIKNAFFNIERLGIIVRRYVLNQYGTTTSHLHTGLPTDRCVAEWYIGSPRVETALAGQSPPSREITARVAVPNEIVELRQNDIGRAREIQISVSGQFLRHFDKGLAVVGFEKSAMAGTYLLGQWESK